MTDHCHWAFVVLLNVCRLFLGVFAGPFLSTGACKSFGVPGGVAVVVASLKYCVCTLQ